MPFGPKLWTPSENWKLPSIHSLELHIGKIENHSLFPLYTNLLANFNPIFHENFHFIATDASDSYIGIVTTISASTIEYSESLSSSWTIVQELYAILHFLRSFPFVSSKLIHLCDNLPIVQMIKKKETSGIHTKSLLKDIFYLANSKKIELMSYWVRSEDNPADYFSRIEGPSNEILSSPVTPENFWNL